MPPELRGNASLNYSGSFEGGSLEENNEQVGKRRLTQHKINYRVEFAPVEGIALVLDLPHTPFIRYSFPEATEMIFEPVSEGGTYSFGETLQKPPDFYGSGIDGIWIGAAVAPFSESYDRNHQVTWRLDLAYRTASSTNIWTAGETGDKRGAAPGGSALKVSAAFSRDSGIVVPFMKFELVRENKLSLDIHNEDGELVTSGLQVAPPSSIDLVGGLEVVTFEDAEDGSRIAFEIFGGFGYRTWGDIPSGILLPSVLDTSRDIPVSVGDHLTLWAGTGFDYQIMEYVRLHTTVGGRYFTPHRLEHVYPVSTSLDTFGVDWSFGAEGRFR